MTFIFPLIETEKLSLRKGTLLEQRKEFILAVAVYLVATCINVEQLPNIARTHG